jgi:septal ring factor EnvC (AmiA/AmiB activator)
MPDRKEEMSGGQKPKTSKLWIFQGVTVVTLIGAAWYLSGRLSSIDGKIEQQSEQIKLVSEQTKSIADAVLNSEHGMAVRLARIEEKVTRLDEWAKTISPKIVKSDFDQEIKRLNARVSELQNQLSGTTQALHTTRADVAREHEASQRLRSQVEALQKDLRQTTQNFEAAKAELSRKSRELELSQELRKQVQDLDSQLSDAAHDLGLLEEETKSTKTPLPEDYRSSLVERLGKLHQKLEDLRRMLKGNAA